VRIRPRATFSACSAFDHSRAYPASCDVQRDDAHPGPQILEVIPSPKATPGPSDGLVHGVLSLVDTARDESERAHDPLVVVAIEVVEAFVAGHRPPSTDVMTRQDAPRLSPLRDRFQGCCQLDETGSETLVNCALRGRSGDHDLYPHDAWNVERGGGEHPEALARTSRGAVQLLRDAPELSVGMWP
jgi:hypothetical protein